MLGIEEQINRAIPEAAKEPERAFQKVAARLLYAYRRQFLTGGDGSWLPAKHQTGGKLMMKSHALFESATTFSDSQSAQLNWGFGLPYARIQQLGGTVPVTAQSRKFFWYQWFTTKDQFWKNMALTKKATFFIPGRSIGLSREDVEYIVNMLGTRDFQITTNWGASILPY